MKNRITLIIFGILIIGGLMAYGISNYCLLYDGDKRKLIRCTYMITYIEGMYPRCK